MSWRSATTRLVLLQSLVRSTSVKRPAVFGGWHALAMDDGRGRELYADD